MKIAEAESVHYVRMFSQRLYTEGTFSLDHLRAIDNVVDGLTNIASVAGTNARMTFALAKQVSDCNLAEPIDPDGIVVSNLRSALSAVESQNRRVEETSLAVQNDPELAHHHKGDVVAATESAILAARGLVAAIHELCNSVEAHDSELAKVIGPFDTLDELLARLQA